MRRLARPVTAIGFSFLLTGAASAAGPVTRCADDFVKEQARSRAVIRELREILRQEEDAFYRGLNCTYTRRQAEEMIEEIRQLLRQCEWAYDNGLPSPVKLPKSAAKAGR